MIVLVSCVIPSGISAINTYPHRHIPINSTRINDHSQICHNPDAIDLCIVCVYRRRKRCDKIQISIICNAATSTGIALQSVYGDRFDVKCQSIEEFNNKNKNIPAGNYYHMLLDWHSFLQVKKCITLAI